MKVKIIIGIVALIVFFVVTRPKALPEFSLLAYDGSAQTEKGQQRVGGSCETEKCLTVYVAPWCPACRRATGMINELVASLESAGYQCQVIVGSDNLESLKAYAGEFNKPVLLDGDREFFNQVNVRAVPFFVVSDWRGNVLKELRGGSTNVGMMRNRLDI